MLTPLRYPQSTLALSLTCLTTARSCLALLIDRYGPDTVYMPMLCPEGVWVPVDRAKVRVRFYPLLDDLNPDVSALRNRLRGSDQRSLFIVIHYCGYKCETRAMRDLAHDHGGLLVEDCAQALLGPASSAAYGDVALFSFNKFLPVVDGGMMLSRTLAADVDLEPKEQLSKSVIAAYYEHLNSNLFIAQSSPVEAAAHLADSVQAYERYYRLINDDLTPCAMSAQAAKSYNDADLIRMGMWRAKVARAWPLNDMRYRPDDCAFALPIRCRGHREVYQNALWDAGVMTATWDLHWLEPERQFKVECEFMRDHLLLPIHEAVDDKAMRRMATIVEAANEGRRVDPRPSGQYSSTEQESAIDRT